MQIIAVGINHKTAPVHVREKLACDPALVPDILARLGNSYPCSEFVLVSTCNRIECYAAVPKAGGPTPLELAKRLADFRRVSFPEVENCFYSRINEEAVMHLFSVTASLDSMVIGESQIASQVKDSYRMACTSQSSGKILNRLFHEAFRTNKQIIRNTSIFNRRVSVAGIAVQKAKRLFPDLRAANVLIVGAGQMGELLIEHFQHEQCRHITVVNRSPHRACQLASQCGVPGKPWEMLDDELGRAHIVVGAASAAAGYLFAKERVQRLLNGRQEPLLIIDITVPRSFDPDIAEIQNVQLYSIDDLAEVARDNIKLRQGDLEKAIEIVYASVSAFMEWFEMRDVGPVIGQIKDAFERIMDLELNRVFSGDRQKADRRETFEASMVRVVNKLCHCMISNIDAFSREFGAEKAAEFAHNMLADARRIIAEDETKNQQ